MTGRQHERTGIRPPSSKQRRRNQQKAHTLIGTLREIYGPAFGYGLSDRDKLSDVLHNLDEPSLSKLVKDHDAGRLHEIIQGARSPRRGRELPQQQTIESRAVTPAFDVVQIFGRAPDDPRAWRVQLRDGTIANISVTAGSSAVIDATIVEYRDVFQRLANE